MEKVQSQAEMTWPDTIVHCPVTLGLTMTRVCVICTSQFPARRRTDKTCSAACQIEHRRNLNREKAKLHYDKHLRRPPRPDSTCHGCGVAIPAPKTGALPKWCTACKAKNLRVRIRARYVAENRSCYKCGVAVPEAVGRPGKTVCDLCRRDPRKHRAASDQRRRLRKYGITQDDYDEMFRSQGHRCAVCRTGDPGPKGFAIDHCHKTGVVRAILCGPCNSALGLLREDAGLIRAMLEYAERHRIE